MRSLSSWLVSSCSELRGESRSSIKLFLSSRLACVVEGLSRCHWAFAACCASSAALVHAQNTSFPPCATGMLPLSFSSYKSGQLYLCHLHSISSSLNPASNQFLFSSHICCRLQITVFCKSLVQAWRKQVYHQSISAMWSVRSYVCTSKLQLNICNRSYEKVNTSKGSARFQKLLPAWMQSSTGHCHCEERAREKCCEEGIQAYIHNVGFDLRGE